MTSGESDAIVVLCTAPAEFDPEPLAADLVRRRLAACVQVGPRLTSTYQWNGALERSAETLLLIKTRRVRFAEVQAAICALHPYEVPEIVALPILAGHPPYLAWLGENTRP